MGRERERERNTSRETGPSGTERHTGGTREREINNLNPTDPGEERRVREIERAGE